MFSNRAISVTAPRLWNDPPPTPVSPLPMKNHHLRPISLSPFRSFHSKQKCHLFKNSYPIIHPPTFTLNDTHLNSYSVCSDPLKMGHKLTMDYSLDNPFDLSQCS